MSYAVISNRLGELAMTASGNSSYNLVSVIQGIHSSWEEEIVRVD